MSLDNINENGTSASAESIEGVENGPVSDWIERYYEEKLDKRDRKKGMGAGLGTRKKGRRDLLSFTIANN